jgi:hypothetical protein
MDFDQVHEFVVTIPNFEDVGKDKWYRHGISNRDLIDLSNQWEQFALPTGEARKKVLFAVKKWRKERGWPKQASFDLPTQVEHYLRLYHLSREIGL